MKSWIYILIIAVGLVACKEERKTAERPANILDREAFVSVMVDMQLIEAMYNRQLSQDEDTVAKDKMYPFMKEIFIKHEIDQEKFDESFEWYTTQPLEMDAVYEEVMNRLSTIAEE